ncbi:copper homeostasis protein cutC homolog isoform X5 [Perca fluviatilis]|uniref:copper homeostasis protein cutC homolog isoform X5 n=1 Tax=Perca fluviatilis TaxID=8168 RepID=UPI00196526FA|nr:copper homeostasis protein cutC homolog isoform X5 [Perca fluviatilis]
MAESFLMEACVDSVESAVNAERGGAGRLELCSSLLEGGLTPSQDQEVEVMRKDIELMKSHGADGLVLGALTEDGQLLLDLCPSPSTETLISLGFQRLLTSGCDNSALEGLPLIKRLIEQAKGRIAIMPGGGINERNLQRILEGSGAEEFHCSARSSRDSAMKFRNTCVTMGATFSAPEYGLKVTDVRKVSSWGCGCFKKQEYWFIWMTKTNSNLDWNIVQGLIKQSYPVTSLNLL